MEIGFHAVGRRESEVGIGKAGLQEIEKKRKVEKDIVNIAKRITQAFL